MRRAARADENQPEVVKALRGIGAEVRHTHGVHKGFPDLCVGFRGNTLLIEVKSPKGKLTKPQEDFFATWPGQAAVVTSAEEAIDYVLSVDQFGVSGAADR